jgi:hypothetical protein
MRCLPGVGGLLVELFCLTGDYSFPRNIKYGQILGLNNGAVIYLAKFP